MGTMCRVCRCPCCPCCCSAVAAVAAAAPGCGVGDAGTSAWQRCRSLQAALQAELLLHALQCHPSIQAIQAHPDSQATRPRACCWACRCRRRTRPSSRQQVCWARCGCSSRHAVVGGWYAVHQPEARRSGVQCGVIFRNACCCAIRCRLLQCMWLFTLLLPPDLYHPAVAGLSGDFTFTEMGDRAREVFKMFCS